MMPSMLGSPRVIPPFAAAMRALGQQEPPAHFTLAGCRYTRSEVVKHDFWAATSFYDGDDGSRVVAKINRTNKFVGIDLAEVGRWLCRREIRFYARLQHLPNIPRLLGKIGSTGFIHEYVPGAPLSKEMKLRSSFFNELHRLIAELHHCDIAYVDANKRENILVGDDGRPYLIDFQISYDLHELGRNILNRQALMHLQAADRYHVLKHQRRLAPDTLTPEQREQATQVSALTRLHRAISWPYFALRRPLMRRLRAGGHLLPEGSK